MPPTTVALHPESHITGPVFGPFPSELVYTQCRIDMRPLPQMTSVGNEFFSRPIFFSSDYCQLHKTRIPKWQCWRLSWQIQSVRKQRAEEFVVTEVSGNRSDLASNVFTLWDRHIYTRESTNKTLSEGDIRPCVEVGRSTSCSRVVRETNCKDVVCLFSNFQKEFFSRDESTSISIVDNCCAMLTISETILERGLVVRGRCHRRRFSDEWRQNLGSIGWIFNDVPTQWHTFRFHCDLLQQLLGGVTVIFSRR